MLKHHRLHWNAVTVLTSRVGPVYQVCSSSSFSNIIPCCHLKLYITEWILNTILHCSCIIVGVCSRPKYVYGIHTDDGVIAVRVPSEGEVALISRNLKCQVYWRQRRFLHMECCSFTDTMFLHTINKCYAIYWDSVIFPCSTDIQVWLNPRCIYRSHWGSKNASTAYWRVAWWYPVNIPWNDTAASYSTMKCTNTVQVSSVW